MCVYFNATREPLNTSRQLTQHQDSRRIPGLKINNDIFLPFCIVLKFLYGPTAPIQLIEIILNKFSWIPILIWNENDLRRIRLDLSIKNPKDRKFRGTFYFYSMSSTFDAEVNPVKVVALMLMKTTILKLPSQTWIRRTNIMQSEISSRPWKTPLVISCGMPSVSAGQYGPREEMTNSNASLTLLWARWVNVWSSYREVEKGRHPLAKAGSKLLQTS